MRRLIAPLVALALLAEPAVAGKVTGFTLDNGMDVVVIENHRAPVVVHMVWYRAGAADEPPGESGVAHYLEHLMFQGTDDLDPGELSATVEANGGSDNAFTTQDYTAFFQRVAADRLDLMMGLEADRMTGLAITAENAKTELDVVLEERNQRVENQPGALFSEQKTAAQYLNHPYGDPVIGWPGEVSALTAKDARAFYEAHYAPDNAVLIVAGDVKPAKVRNLAEKNYGDIPSGDVPARSRPQEPPQRAERRLTMHDARVGQPYLTRSYLAPERDPGDQADAAALTVLAQLLGGSGVTSVLGEALQIDEKIALHTGAFYGATSVDDTTFNLVVVPRGDVSLDKAEAALDDALAEFLEDGVDADRLSRVKMSLRADRIYSQDSVQAQARRYGKALATGLSVADVEAWPKALQAVTPAEVMAAARDVLDRRHAVTGRLEGAKAETKPEKGTQ